MKKCFENIIFAILAGFSMLGLVHVLGAFLGFTFKLNIATIGIATFLGAPGVALLLFFSFIFYV